MTQEQIDSAGILSQEQAEPSLPIRIDLGDRTQVLRHLTTEWKAAWSKLGFSNSTTIVDVAKRLDIDRGTAQRLNRIAKCPDAEAANVGQFPGVRAWQRVLAGAENVLGAEHSTYQNLSIACDEFAKWLGEMGGSRSSAMRHIGSADEDDKNVDRPKSEPDGAGHLNARETWVDSAIEVFGYSVDLRFDLQMSQENKASESPRLDLAMVHVLKGCRGNVGALPITFSRSAYNSDRTELQSSKEGNARKFQVLNSITSKPAPALLTTVDAQRQTVFVEPNWTSMQQPLDLAIMHEERDAMVSPWSDSGFLETATVNRHPNRKLVMERFISRAIASKCTASLRCFRTQMILTQEEPWFDRIPERTRVQKIDTIEEARQNEVFPGYDAALSEVMTRLNWDWDDMVVYRAEILNPMPLATYTIKFDASHA